VRKSLFYIILSLSVAAAGSAQSLSLALFQHSTDNLFQTRYGEKDQVSNVSFSLDQPLRPFSFFTEGGYSYLAENTRISFYTQELGVDYLWAASEKTALYASVKAGGAIYRADYSDFNHFSLGFLGAAKSYMTPSSILKLTYTFDYKIYPLDRYDFSSHLASLSLDKYFPTRTTLKAEGTWGYKRFLHPLANQSSAAEPAVSGGAGAGRGRMPGAGLFGQAGDLIGPAASGGGLGIQIASVSGLLAQGFGDRLGVRLSGFRQWTLSGENPFTSVAEIYLVENPTYDVFSWNGYGLSGEATVEGPWNTQLKFGYTRFDKRFPGIEAIDLAGTSLGLLRRDARKQWDIRLEKNFPAFTLYAFYTFIDNASNDPLFDWKGHFIGVSAEWRLSWGKRR
jgi:hypothetical protein